MQCEKQRAAAKSHKQTPEMCPFCSPGVAEAPQKLRDAADTKTGLRAAFGATKTLKLEFKWI